MKLEHAAFLSSINAGGPGSGRRPGDGQQGMHDKLAKHGWKLTGDYSGHRLYQHDDKAKQSVYTKPDGSWTHEQRGEGLKVLNKTTGNGADSLGSHLDKLHGKD